jgi:hypothetical protein
MSRHREASAAIPAAAEALFEWLDDPARLGGHMSESSPMMGGGRMGYIFDAARGQSVGSVIRMDGQAFGLSLSLEEVVVERTPPRRKVWRTIGHPRLIIIGAYEMGFEITPQDDLKAELRIWIDYELPERGLGRRTPRLAGLYARWCVRQMVADAARHFGGEVRA